MADDRFDHAGMEVMSTKECLRVLHDRTMGRIGFVDGGEVVILPIAYRFRHGRVFFLSSGGSKLDAASRGRRVAFEVDGWDGETRTGWSVLLRGRCSPVPPDDEELAAESGLLPWLSSPLRPMEWIQIVPDEITGRRLPGSQIPPDWD